MRCFAITLSCFFTTLLLIAGCSSVVADGLDFTGFIGVESRFFPEVPAFENQSDDLQGSLIFQPELRYSPADGVHQLSFMPFLRLDSEERSHFDIREAYWRYTATDYRLLIGINKVFWGVAESNHLVDIINQTDNLEDIDQEEKLGQPMILLSSEKEWGELELYLMPYFRKREFVDEQGRLRSAIPVGGDERYESGAEEYHLDIAIRYSHYFGDWDVGGYYFYGTSREPLLSADEQGEALNPYYSLIHQWGTDIQFTRDAWLWKFEGIARQGNDEFFTAMVGGFEYTIYQVGASDADLGLLLEYNWDGRDDKTEPVVILDNDVFIGSRFALNDTQDTTALLGAIIDIDHGSTILSLEAERRLGQSWVVELTGRFFLGVAEEDVLQSFERDSFFNLSLRYYF